MGELYPKKVFKKKKKELQTSFTLEHIRNPQKHFISQTSEYWSVPGGGLQTSSLQILSLGELAHSHSSKY